MMLCDNASWLDAVWFTDARRALRIAIVSLLVVRSRCQFVFATPCAAGRSRAGVSDSARPANARSRDVAAPAADARPLAEIVCSVDRARRSRGRAHAGYTRSPRRAHRAACRSPTAHGTMRGRTRVTPHGVSRQGTRPPYMTPVPDSKAATSRRLAGQRRGWRICARCDSKPWGFEGFHCEPPDLGWLSL